MKRQARLLAGIELVLVLVAPCACGRSLTTSAASSSRSSTTSTTSVATSDATTSTTAAARVEIPGAVVITFESLPTEAHVCLGQTVALIVPAPPHTFGPDGHPYVPPPPFADDAYLRQVDMSVGCPPATRCTTWTAVAVGTTSIRATNEVGIVCYADGNPPTTSCAGIAAAYPKATLTIDSADTVTRTITTSGDDGQTVDVATGTLIRFVLDAPQGVAFIPPSWIGAPQQPRDIAPPPVASDTSVLTPIGDPPGERCDAGTCYDYWATHAGTTDLTIEGYSKCDLPCDPLHPALVAHHYRVTIAVT